MIVKVERRRRTSPPKNQPSQPRTEHPLQRSRANGGCGSCQFYRRAPLNLWFGPGKKKRREKENALDGPEGRQKKKTNHRAMILTKYRTSIATESRQWGLWFISILQARPVEFAVRSWHRAKAEAKPEGARACDNADAQEWFQGSAFALDRNGRAKPNNHRTGARASGASTNPQGTCARPVNGAFGSRMSEREWRNMRIT